MGGEIREMQCLLLESAGAYTPSLGVHQSESDDVGEHHSPL